MDRRMAGLVAGAVLLACTRGGSSPPPRSPAPTTIGTTSAPSPTVEPTPGPRADLIEGFDPPAELLRPPPPLDAAWYDLVPPAEASGASFTPLRVPWPEGVELLPPQAQPPVPAPRPCRREHHLAHDTRPLRTVALEYDANGRVVEERIDEDTDGTIDRRLRYAWGTHGQLVRSSERIGPEPTCDGLLPAVDYETSHRYDAHGVWLGAQLRQGRELVSEGPWRITGYDPHGRPQRWVEHQHGSVLRAITLRWDDRDRLLERVTTYAMQPIEAERWHYGEGDRERYHAQWANGSWSVDREQLDDRGRVVVVQRDHEGDGIVDAHERRRYDTEGRELERWLDTDLDGEAETHTRQTWDHDDAGRLLRWSRQTDGSWVEDLEEHRYDAQGREVERRIERAQAVRSAGDLAGYVEREHWRGEHDDRGRLVREHVLQGELGPNERIERVYECREPYARHPRRNPLDHPETAAECFEVFE